MFVILIAMNEHLGSIKLNPLATASYVTHIVPYIVLNSTLRVLLLYLFSLIINYKVLGLNTARVAGGNAEGKALFS